MSGFKLIAIIPLKGCDKDFRKNLKLGKPYQFYRQYKIGLDGSGSRIEFVRKKANTIPSDLYSLRNGIELNFSAVVGENGSGKSTLFELLYYLIYIIGTEKKIGNRDLIFHKSKDLEEKREQMRLEANSFEEKLNKIKSTPGNDDLSSNAANSLSFLCHSLIAKFELQLEPKPEWNKLEFYQNVLDELKLKYSRLHPLIVDEKKHEHKIKTNLNISILYEVDSVIYEVTHFNQEFAFYTYSSDSSKTSVSLSKFDLSMFFYNVSINYSHHALNSRTLGNWIAKLFHKNDAYTTPVVINPMRNEGNFNVNNELALSKERLMSNLIFDLVQDKESLLLDKYRVSKFVFTPKKLNVERLGYDVEFLSNLKSGHLISNMVGIEQIPEYIHYWEFAIGYLEDKIERIKAHYPFLVYDKAIDKKPDTQLNEFLMADSSHVTKKVRQVINFLKISYKPKNRAFWETPKSNVRIKKDRFQILEWLNKFDLQLRTLNPAELLEYALPGFFSIDFELEDLQGHKIKFGNLSSGEQQMILNINSIQYHLYNLQSVHALQRKQQESGKQAIRQPRVKYKNINVILDEVELYYHPEMQRKLVKNLMDAFENVKNKGENGISSISVCFLTHSPFILSDIPSENVLRLNPKQKEKKRNLEETFAANIHDLLASGFFMETLMGEFAEEKISQIIERVKQGNSYEEDQKIIDLIGDSFLRISVDQFKKTQDDQD